MCIEYAIIFNVWDLIYGNFMYVQKEFNEMQCRKFNACNVYENFMYGGEFYKEYGGYQQ